MIGTLAPPSQGMECSPLCFVLHLNSLCMKLITIWVAFHDDMCSNTC